MAWLTTDGNMMREKARLKQVIEQHLVDAMYGSFDSPQALTGIRATVKAALKSMLKGPFHALSRAVQKEDKMDVWRNQSATPGGAGILKLINRADHFSAGDCSDVIRLVGEWVEQGGLDATGAATKEAFRPGINRNGTAALGHPDSTVHKGAKAAAWADGKDYRWGAGKDSIELPYKKENYPKVRDRIDAPKGGVLPLPAPVHKRPNQGTAGRELKAICGKSNVLKMDRLFGLSEMCDISGTTADSTFAVEVWGHKCVNLVEDLSPVYYLLPLATLVSGAHHSLIESALALSLNQVIATGYRIGFYTTLLPGGSIPKHLESIRNHLQSAENRTRMHGLHFLRYYQGTNVAGGIVFEDEDINAFRNSPLSLATKVLANVPTLPEYPTLDHVRQFCRSCDIAFYNSKVLPALVPGGH